MTLKCSVQIFKLAIIWKICVTEFSFLYTIGYHILIY